MKIVLWDLLTPADNTAAPPNQALLTPPPPRGSRKLPQTPVGNTAKKEKKPRTNKKKKDEDGEEDLSEGGEEDKALTGNPNKRLRPSTETIPLEQMGVFTLNFSNPRGYSENFMEKIKSLNIARVCQEEQVLIESIANFAHRRGDSPSLLIGPLDADSKFRKELLLMFLVEMAGSMKNLPAAVAAYFTSLNVSENIAPVLAQTDLYANLFPRNSERELPKFNVPSSVCMGLSYFSVKAESVSSTRLGTKGCFPLSFCSDDDDGDTSGPIFDYNLLTNEFLSKNPMLTVEQQGKHGETPRVVTREKDSQFLNGFRNPENRDEAVALISYLFVNILSRSNVILAPEHGSLAHRCFSASLLLEGDGITLAQLRRQVFLRSAGPESFVIEALLHSLVSKEKTSISGSKFDRVVFLLKVVGDSWAKWCDEADYETKTFSVRCLMRATVRSTQQQQPKVSHMKPRSFGKC